MMWYLFLKWLHIVAACIYLGISASNGFIKLRADKSRIAHKSATALRIVAEQNVWFLFPASGILLITGLLLADQVGVSILKGWLALGIVGFTLLCFVLIVSYRMEKRLLFLAEQSRSLKSELSIEYWRISRYWMVLGAFATCLIGMLLFVMTAKRGLW